MKRISAVLLFAIIAMAASTVNAQIAFDGVSQKQMVMTNMSSMPLAFTENRGQWGEKPLFRAEAGGATFYFCKDEVAYLFVRDTNELEELPYDAVARHAEPEAMPRGWRQESFPDAQSFEGPLYKKEALLIKAQFVDANPNPEVIGEDRLPYNCNYFYGNDPAKWRTDVPNYSAITYKDIWPGIDLKYHGNGKWMKYDFIVNPGADITRMKLRYAGIDNLAVTPQGDLRAETIFGPVFEKAPYIYQEIAGTEHTVMGRYVLTEPGVFGFTLEGEYSPNHIMIVDPQLAYSTFLGGDSVDVVTDIAVDADGCLYGVGDTRSPNFPTENPYDDSLGSHTDVMVFKLSPLGDTLIFSTFIGGTNPWYASDEGEGIVLDLEGNIYITGKAESTDFPLVNPIDDIFQSKEIFISKLSPAGNALLFSTFLGGQSLDSPRGIDLDSQNNICVVGLTGSADFPVVNPYDGDISALNDIVVVVLSAPDYSLTYSTYLGGNNVDVPYDISVDDDNIYITGATASTDFPLVNPVDAVIEGASEVFASKISPYIGGINSLVYSTFIGGSGVEYGYGIKVDENEIAYIIGVTQSPDFPLVNSFDLNYEGESEAFVLKLSALGNSLLFSTFLGGDGSDAGADIAVDGSGNMYIAVNTTSSDYPVINPYDGSYNGDMDVFLAKFSESDNCLLFSSYFGTNASDVVNAIALDDAQNIYFSGWTNSPDFPVANPYDSAFNGQWDGYIARIDLDQVGPYLANISGTVTDEEQTPVENAYIFLDGIEPHDITDMNGEFNFNDICPLTYDIFVSHPLFCDTLITNIEVGVNEAINIDIILLRNGSISGHSTNLASMPVEGVYVYIDGLDISDTTDIEGAYSLNSLCPGSYDVIFLHPEYTDSIITSVNVTSGNITTVDVILNNSGSVAGTVTNFNFHPIAKVRVGIVGSSTYTYTDISGHYSFINLDAGNYDIAFSHDNYKDTSVADVSITPDDTASADIRMAFLPEYDVNLWFGGHFDADRWVDTVTAFPNQNLDVDVWLQSNADDWISSSILLLGANDAYFDTMLESECSIYYPLSEWEVKSFCNYISYPHFHSLMFVGFQSLSAPSDNPLLHSDIPIRILTFAVHVKDDNSLLGYEFCDAFQEGDYINLHRHEFSDTAGLPVSFIDQYACVRFGDENYGLVSGIVNDAQHIPLEGAIVCTEGGSYIDSTDNNGEYAFNVPQGIHDIWYIHPLCCDTVVTGVTITGSDTTIVDMMMGAGGSLTGNVHDEFLNPIEGVEIVAVNTFRSDTTDSMGSYLLSGLCPVSHDLLFQHPHYRDTTIVDFVIYANITDTLNVVMTSLPYANYLPGDVNMSVGAWPPSATGPDVTYLVNFFRGISSSQSCLLSGFWCSADANGDCTIIGSDVTKLVNVFRGITSISYCPDYPPAWPPIPEVAPSGWPGCE